MSYRHFIVEPISPNQVNVVEEGNDKIAAHFGNYAAAVAFAQAENMRRAQADAVKVAAPVRRILRDQSEDRPVDRFILAAIGNGADVHYGAYDARHGTMMLAPEGPNNVVAGVKAVELMAEANNHSPLP